MLPQSNGAELDSAVSKATRRLVPFLAILLFVNYVDRVNVGFAAPHMNPDIGLSTYAYGVGVALFFVGYILVEIPSNYWMHRLGARIWFARIMITWGIAAALHAAIVGPTSFAVMRVLLGIAEAGFIPGVLLYFTLWFPLKVRATVIGAYYVALPLSIALGGPLSEWLMVIGDGFMGMAGWRFMFLAEGLVAAVLGIIVLLILPSKPRDAKWLSSGEAKALEDALEADDATVKDRTHSFKGAFKDRRLLTLTGVFFCMTFPMYAITFFLPLIIAGMREYTGELTAVQTALVPFVPYSLAAIACWLWTARLKNRQPGPWHYSAPIAMAGVAVIVSSFATTNVWLLMVSVSVAAVGIYAAAPVFWTLSGRFVSGAAAASGLALINSVGAFGGFVAGYLTGWLRELTGTYIVALMLMGVSLFVSSLLTVWLFNKRQARAGETVAELS